MGDFLIRLMWAAVVALVVKGGVALLGSTAPWWLAAGLGGVLLFLIVPWWSRSAGAGVR